MLESAESEQPNLTIGEIILEEFQPRYLNVTDRGTDDFAVAIRRIASRRKIAKSEYLGKKSDPIMMTFATLKVGLQAHE